MPDDPMMWCPGCRVPRPSVNGRRWCVVCDRLLRPMPDDIAAASRPPVNPVARFTENMLRERERRLREQEPAPYAFAPIATSTPTAPELRPFWRRHGVWLAILVPAAGAWVAAAAGVWTPLAAVHIGALGWAAADAARYALQRRREKQNARREAEARRIEDEYERSVEAFRRDCAELDRMRKGG